jgi:hypothetical protein
MLFGHSPRDDSLLTRGKLWADDFDQHIASANALDEQVHTLVLYIYMSSGALSCIGVSSEWIALYSLEYTFDTSPSHPPFLTVLPFCVFATVFLRVMPRR